MTMPTRRIRTGRRLRTFDLRATALFFTLLAIVLIVLAFTVRAAAAAAERRPAWTAVLCLVGTSAVVLTVRRHRRRHLTRRAAHQAAAALREATRSALDALETPVEEAPLAFAGPVPAAAPAPRDLMPEPVPAYDMPAYGMPAAEVPAGDLVTEPLPTAYGAPVDYDALDADEFEQAVAALCERDGCSSVEVVGGAGDLGADVLAVAPDGRRVVIQCKRYCDTNRVGSQDLQRFGGTCYTVHDAEVAAVVTTSEFTAPAAEYAAQCGIVCVDGQALRAWSEGTGPEPWSPLITGLPPTTPRP
ncbi:restriction endonuclease [Streptomyces sp. NPDC047017]|uniref:restriction endonuclease n=1 Tax=Streptomyces sp. NPDC047017 TaxID=3155024 RepID=UPI0033C2BBE7